MRAAKFTVSPAQPLCHCTTVPRHRRDQMFVGTVHDGSPLFRIELPRHSGRAFDIAEKNRDDTALGEMDSVL